MGDDGALNHLYLAAPSPGCCGRYGSRSDRPGAGSIASGTHNGHRRRERQRNIPTIESPLPSQINHLQATCLNELYRGHGPLDDVFWMLQQRVRVQGWNMRWDNTEFNALTPLTEVAERGDG